MNKLFLETVELKHAYTPAIQEKTVFSFFSVDVSELNTSEYLTTTTKKSIYLCVFMYPVRYNFVVILFWGKLVWVSFWADGIVLQSTLKGRKMSVVVSSFFFSDHSLNSIVADVDMNATTYISQFLQCKTTWHFYLGDLSFSLFRNHVWGLTIIW